jgi:hypothetical protein
VAMLTHYKEAQDFLASIPDPIVQSLIQHAHSLLFTEASEYFTTDFDLLLFYKVLAALFRDRKMLAKALTGEMKEHPWVAD